MISIGLRDFRGCERADLEAAPIALVAGRNATGKSSIAQAVGAALCGNILPVIGLTKAAAGMLVKAGSTSAVVMLKNESGTVRVEWPSCQATTQGEPPHASIWAAGLDSVALQPARDRARILGEYLHADPTREDLAAALADIELGDETVIAAVWELIDQHGWDGAHALRKEKGAELKGAWRQVTGKTYGSRVAASWAPERWQFELTEFTQATDNDLCAAVVRATDEHNKAIAAAAVSSAERQRLGQEMARIEQHKDTLQHAEAEAEQVALALSEAQNARGKLPGTGDGDEMPCPHCGAMVVLHRVSLVETRLEKGPTISAAALKKRRLAVAELDGAVSRLTNELRAADRAVEVARDALQIALDAKHRLEKMPAPAEGSADVEAAQANLEAAQKHLAAFRQKREADALHRQIAGNDALLAIIAPDGLRARKLAQVLDMFNRLVLVPLVDAAQWQAVTVEPEMTLTYGGRPYALCSQSEKYRVGVILQVAMARLDGSQMVVIDGSDVLDATLRSGLFALLEETELAALVTMTLSRPEQMPDLAKLGMGTSYWLENGIAQTLYASAEVAA